MLSAMLAPLVLLSSTSCVRVARSFQHLQASAPFAVARRARSSSATGAGGAHRSAATSSDAVVTELTPEELGELDFVPQSFAQCINDAATATARAIADGKMLLEVEFPPLATDLIVRLIKTDWHFRRHRRCLDLQNSVLPNWGGERLQIRFGNF